MAASSSSSKVVPAAPLGPQAPRMPARRGTIALANSTVIALVQQVANGGDRMRHEAYGSLWRLVRSSNKLQLSVFDSLRQFGVLGTVFKDISHEFRGLRQSAAKLTLSLLHRSTYIQKVLEQSPKLSHYVVQTDVICREGDTADTRPGGCISLLACGRQFSRQHSRLETLRRQIVGNDEGDDAALGSAIVTAVFADAQFLPDSNLENANSNCNEFRTLGDEKKTLKKFSSAEALTLPSLDWRQGPVDPDRCLLGFVNDGPPISRHTVDKSEDTQSKEMLPSGSLSPIVVKKHMHRWKDHVSKSLLKQLSVLHEVYRTTILVEERQRGNDAEPSSNIVEGSVSKATFALVFRHFCAESTHQPTNKLMQTPHQASPGNLNVNILNKKTSENLEQSGQNSQLEEGELSTKDDVKYNSSLSDIHHLISSRIGVHQVPNGLRGVMLFDDCLVSRHNRIFTECPGRIRSWDVFRRYWVQRWAADRLRSQLGLELCKMLRNCFDDTVEDETVVSHTAGSLSHSEIGVHDVVEVKATCSEFHKRLLNASFIDKASLRDIALGAIMADIGSEKNENPEKYAISWGMYMHALIFQIHENHSKEENERVKKEEAAAMNTPKPFDYFDPRATLNKGTTFELDQSSSTCVSRSYQHEEIDAGSDSSFGSVEDESPKTAKQQNSLADKTTTGRLEQTHISRGLRITSTVAGKSKASPSLTRARVYSKRHALIHRLAYEQRHLRKRELELQHADEKALARMRNQRFLSPERKRRLEERDAQENRQRERLRAQVNHIKRGVARLNERVGALTGGEHKLVTAATGISLVEESTLISRLEDAKSKHKRELHERVARNKKKIEQQIELKRKSIEAKAAKKRKRPSDKLRFRQKSGTLAKNRIPRRPVSAGARTRRIYGSRIHGNNINRGKSATRMRRRSNGRRVGSSPSLKSSQGRSFTKKSKVGDDPSSYESARNSNPDKEENITDDVGDIDSRFHDFGMPGHGTSRAWREMKLFFAERVRINKVKEAKARRRRAKRIRRRESEHIKRVQRRKNARSRSAHASLVSRHRATEKVLAERTRSAEVEALRVSKAFEMQHNEDISWIKSEKFSPRARAQAYDNMRRLAYSATPTPGNHHEVSESFTGNYERPQSASPRLRSKANITAIMPSNSGVHSLSRMHLDMSRTKAPSPTSGFSSENQISLSARDSKRSKVVVPTRPSTARTSHDARKGRPESQGVKYSHLISELEDAKSLLEKITSEQEALQDRVSRTMADFAVPATDGGASEPSNPQSSDRVSCTEGANTVDTSSKVAASVTADSTQRKSENAGNAHTSMSGKSHAQQSLVNAAIVEAVQMQMLQQWPRKHMSLRVRRLVHTQLRSRAETRALNVELDHATQRLTGKNKKKNMTTKSSWVDSENLLTENRSKRWTGKPPAPQVRPTDAASAFGHLRPVSGASPLIKFRRLRSQNA